MLSMLSCPYQMYFVYYNGINDKLADLKKAKTIGLDTTVHLFTGLFRDTSLSL